MKNITRELRSAVLKTAAEYSMLDCSSLLVGFSGGADSTVLLHILDGVCRERGIALRAIHINHMIRGEEADRDELFCKEFCEKLGIPFTSVRIDIPALSAKEKLGTEECARKYRYAAYNDCCRDHRIEKIATAHNADDNIETIVFNLARGSGLAGVCGILPVRDNIIRPLIRVSKEDILCYAGENGLSFVYDSTNSDENYSRNLIRQRVIPELKKINPSLIGAGSGFSQRAALDLDYLESEAEKFRNIEDARALADMHPALLSRVIAKKYSDAEGTGLEAVHINDLIGLIKRGGDGYITLPGGLAGAVAGGRFTISAPPECREISFRIELKKGRNLIEATGDELFLLSERKSADDIADKLKNINKNFILTELNSANIGSSLIARSRLPGDSYRYGGMTRSVKKMLSGSGLSRKERARLPFICDENGIIFIPGFRARDGASPAKEDKNREQPKNTAYIIYAFGDFKYV